MKDKIYAFKHENDKPLYALSIDRTGADVPNGPWQYWKEVTIRPTGVIGCDPVKAAKDIEEHGWHLHRWHTA